jgi:hypothetical protein
VTRSGRLVAAALVAVAPLAPGAAAAESAACDGVLVLVAPGDAVDASIGCAAGAPSSGLAALADVGHRYTFVPGIPGMVCTIDGHPDPCNGAPADAYWSYWHADPGGEWVYATRGAADREPPRGTVEGWVFGAGEPPPAPAPSGEDVTDARPSGPVTATRPIVAVTAGLLVVGLGGAAVRRARARPGDGATTASSP